MFWMSLIRAASAGCIAWSEDDEARLATSAVIVAGTVRDLDLVDGAVRLHVEVDQTWKGHVTSGWLTLVTGLSGGFCPGDRVFPVGARVFVIGDPNPDGEVAVGPCVPSFGPFGDDPSRLVELADRSPSSARRVDGSAPATIQAAIAPFPKATTPDRARVIRAGVLDLGGERHTGDGAAVVLEGAVLAQRDGRIRGIWETDELHLVGWVDASDVEVVPIRRVTLAPGVGVAPGTSLRDGATYDAVGVEVSGSVPAASMGRVWRPAPVEDVDGTAWVLRDVEWVAVPGGPPIGRLAADGGFALARTGAATAGLVPVRIGAPGLVADGWLPEDAVRDEAGGLLHGIAGGIVDSSPTVILPEGTEIVSLDAPAVVARTTVALIARRFAGDGERVWVLVPTPWGSIGGVVRYP